MEYIEHLPAWIKAGPFVAGLFFILHIYKTWRENNRADLDAHASRELTFAEAQFKRLEAEIEELKGRITNKQEMLEKAYQERDECRQEMTAHRLRLQDELHERVNEINDLKRHYDNLMHDMERSHREEVSRLQQGIALSTFLEEGVESGRVSADNLRQAADKLDKANEQRRVDDNGASTQ